MSEPKAQKTYAEKEERLNEILSRLDKSQTPIDDLAAEAKEAAQLIMSMQATLTSAKHEITEVFKEMEKEKQKEKDESGAGNGFP